MITESTVLILGAGASHPYGFPLGPELKSRVWRLLRAASGGAYDCAERAASYEPLLAMGFNPDLIEEFSLKLERSPRTSVDAFLENQPKFLEVGKAAIAATMLPLEDQEALLSEPKSEERKWYQKLYNSLGRSLAEIRDNKLVTLTFNYDRSLETYLLEAIKNDFGLSTDDTHEVLTHLPILHLYGSLGTDDFNGLITEGRIERAANSIRVISDDSPRDDPTFQQAWQHIQQSSNVCFLGFGYDESNINRLRISNDWPRNSYGRDFNHDPLPSKTVSGTTYGMTPKQIDDMVRRFEVNTSFPTSLCAHDIFSYLDHVHILG